jgi:hypothetical protein
MPAQEGEWKMNCQLENRNTLFSGAFNETLWETLIALGVCAGICISLIGLSAHLSQAKALSPAVGHLKAEAVSHEQ